MVENLENSEKKQNIVIEFLMAWVEIGLFALKGLKFLLFDLWVLLFNHIKWSLTKPLDRTAESVSAENIYKRTKFSLGGKTKVYKYSKKTLAKYEKMKEALAQDLQMSGATRSKVANIYQYTVKDKNGRIFKDTMPGFSKLDINSFLVNEGYEVYDIRTNSTLNFVYKDSAILGNKMSIKNLVFWLTQLATYLKSGITLNESMRILTIQMKKNKKVQKAFQQICYELSLGESFSNALAKQGNYFPALLINMIKAGEASGTMQETLDDMAKYYTEVNNTRKEMISALTYPAIITVFSIAVVTFIIVYVVPQFVKVYAANRLTITGITAVIISLSNFLSNNLLYVIIGIIAVMIVIYIAYKKIKKFRVAVQITMMHLPIIKNVIIYKEINIFAKTFASLLRNNVYITESMDILSKITNNEIYRAIMYKTIDNIVKGEKISEAFKDHWAVPDIAYYMIVTGESTGQLDDMMQKVSDYYQSEHKAIVSALKSFIEPVMIVLLAIMVGIIIISVILPMYQLYNQLL